MKVWIANDGSWGTWVPGCIRVVEVTDENDVNELLDGATDSEIVAMGDVGVPLIEEDPHAVTIPAAQWAKFSREYGDIVLRSGTSKPWLPKPTEGNPT